MASETFMAVYRNLDSFREQAKLSTWLWSIAYRRAVSYLRKRGQPTAWLDRLDQVEHPRTKLPEAAIEEDEQAEMIWQAVQRLPRLWALAIILFYREDKGIGEIADILQTPAGTVKTYLFRGRKRLKESLSAFWEGRL